MHDGRRRVRKTTVAGGTVDFLYDLPGHEVAQISSTGTWTRGEVYAGGRHVATYTGGTGGTTYFVFADCISPRTIPLYLQIRFSKRYTCPKSVSSSSVKMIFDVLASRVFAQETERKEQKERHESGAKQLESACRMLSLGFARSVSPVGRQSISNRHSGD